MLKTPSNQIHILGDHSSDLSHHMQEIDLGDSRLEEVPPKTILNSAIKIEGYDQMRKEIKAKNAEVRFISETNKLLEWYAVDKKHYDAEIVQFVCQMAAFLRQVSKNGSIQMCAVTACVKKFFDGNEELVETIIKLVLPNIQRSTAYTRLRHRISRFFLRIQYALGITN